MRRIAALVLLVCLAGAGCGGDDGKKAAAAAARQLDPGSELVAAVDADYGDGNWQQIKRLYARLVKTQEINFGDFTPPTLDGALTTAASSAGLSFEEDIRPLLDGTLLIGVDVEPAPALSPAAQRILDRVDRSRTRFTDDGREIYYDHDGRRIRDIPYTRIRGALDDQSREPKLTFTAVYRVPDPEALQRVLTKLRDQGLEPDPIPGVTDARKLTDGVALVGRDTLVAVYDGDADTADQKLRQRLTAGGSGPAVPELKDDFIAMRATPELLGAWLDSGELDRALATAAGKALRGAALRMRLDDDAARVNARVDFDGLSPDALPLPGPGPLALPPNQPVASASANQSLTTVFLSRLARALYPESRFVRRVQRLERRTGVNFDAEVLRQFTGPSFTVLRPRKDNTNDFAARSTLRDPAAMRALLPRLAPDLPGIVEGLQGLGSSGLSGLLFVAPDAPLTPSAFGLLAGVRITRLPGADVLYEIRGLDPRHTQPGPDRVVYGIVGDAFVVASSQPLAREVARMPTAPAPKAGTRLRVDVAEVARATDPEDSRELRALASAIELSASAQDGDIVADATVKWAR
jgi:hypothetical protein